MSSTLPSVPAVSAQPAHTNQPPLGAPPRHRPSASGPAGDLGQDTRPTRLFFALWPDAATVRTLHDWATRAHATCGGRIMRPDTLHLTLGFLGETAPDTLQALARETAARRIEPGVVVLNRYGAFPRPRIVWAGPGNGENGTSDDDGARRLADEHRQLWDWVRPLHPARPEPRFRPHVTLLRNADTGVLPGEPPPPIVWRYDRYVLVASILDGAARYQIIASTQV